MIRLNLKATELRPDGLRFDPVSGVLLAPTAKLRPDPKQPRKHFDAKELKQLRADIDAWREAGRGLCGTGLMEPLKGRWEAGALNDKGEPKKSAKIDLFDGERRWRATHEDYPWLPITLETLSESEARDAALRTSLQKKLLTPIEEAHAFSQKMQAEKWSAYQCGKHYSVGESYVRNRIGLLECSPASQKLVTKHPDAMSHVLLLHDWKPRISADDEKELLREVESGLTYQALREEVEKRADALEAKSDAQRAPDRETASRRSTHARTGGGNVSRGREVKGADAREARREAEGALATAGQYIETARGWMESLSEDERQKLSGKYAFALRRRLKEIFPEIP